MMSVTCYYLIVIVVVLLQLLIISSSRLDPHFDGTEQCFNEGTIVTYQCQVPALPGTLDWNGVGFDCPSSNTASNNIIVLPTISLCPSPFADVLTGTCGPYRANLTCTEDQEYLLSVLTFETIYEMNGGIISCLFHGGETEIFSVRVGVTPNPPSHVRATPRQDGSCQFEWTPPNESIGGIRGYNIRYGENCRNCTPEPGFVNKTDVLTAECSECIKGNSNLGYFEVNTVSEDCSFYSEAARSSVIITDTSPTVMTRQCIEVSLKQQCNESADSFQALLQFADGAACTEKRLNKTTENYTFQNYCKTCIPVGTDSICFSAVVSRNGVEVTRTVSQELILLQCDTSTLSPNYDTGVQLTNSSSIDILSSGVNVPHNSMLKLQCSTCTLMGTNTTRCVNGTFEPLVNQSTYCNCPVDPYLRTHIAVVAVLDGSIFIFIIAFVIICKLRLRKIRSDHD